ncbi:MAG: TolC family protein [Chitinophagaceae bacterium]|nr:TolC family protein [Chitinophagaceae bacterium]
MFSLRQTIVITGLMVIPVFSKGQLFNQETKELFLKAAEKNDTLQIYEIRKQQSNLEITNAKYSFLPRVLFNATYTRLNDDIVFPANLQQLLLGSQALLVKEKIGIPFNTALPSAVALQPVSPIQQKDILKTTISSQMLLFSGFKVSNGIKALKHQQKSLDYLTDKQNTKLFLEIADVYDKTALLQSSDAIISSSEKY